MLYLKRNILHPKKNLYTIFTSQINNKTITSSKTTYLRNSNNKPVPNTPPSVSLPSIPSKKHLKKYKDNNKRSTPQYVTGTQTNMIKKHKLFQLSAPSQLKQTLDCASLSKVKNNDSRCKTRDATKKLYTEDITLVRKT